MKTLFLSLLVIALAGCSTPGYYVPTERMATPDRSPDLIETGSVIPHGDKQEVRDTTQPVDVYSEQELENDRPANTEDAVRRALRGR